MSCVVGVTVKTVERRVGLWLGVDMKLRITEILSLEECRDDLSRVNPLYIGYGGRRWGFVDHGIDPSVIPVALVVGFDYPLVDDDMFW